MPLSPLVPEPARPAHELLAVVRPRERAGADRPFVFVNMVATADGRGALEGSTRPLGGEDDTDLLLELRAIADAVLIGTGTLRAEGYDRLLRAEERRARRIAAGFAEDPVAVLLSRRFDIPWEAGLFQSPEQPVLIYTGVAGTPPDVPAPVEVVVLDDPAPAAALADLRGRGVRALLCEGGPTLNRALLAGGLVDELFLTLAPQLAGTADALRIVEGDDLPATVELRLEWVLHHDHELYLRYGVRDDR